MPVTIKDIVALAEVSPSTVSRICRDHPSISRQAKEEIRQAMAKLDYESNSQASSLATQNFCTVGTTLPPSEWEAYRNPFYLEMTRGISQYCNQRQYINTVTMGQNENEALQVTKTMARTGLAEGFITLYSREQGPVLDYLYEEGLLHVFVRKACRDVDQITYVDNDNMLAGREVAEYLLNLGHVGIARLSRDRFLLYDHDRKMGYMLVLAERGIPLDGQLRAEVPSVPEEQDQALGILFVREDGPTTVPVSDDILAVALEKICIGLGPSIPGDVPILSFNNSLLSRLILPPLTSVDVNACQLGTEAAAQMISHMEDPELVATKIIVSHHLVERESCAGIGWLCGDWGTETI